MCQDKWELIYYLLFIYWYIYVTISALAKKFMRIEIKYHLKFLFSSILISTRSTTSIYYIELNGKFYSYSF